MTKIFTESNAYEVIQKDVSTNLHTYLGVDRFDIKNIYIIGAYHGYEIRKLLHNYPKAVVHAYEAHPKHFEVLQNNFKDFSRVVPINKIVSDVCGTCNFYELGNGGEGSGSILPFNGTELGHPFTLKETLVLESTTLKHIKEPIDLLWIDVQGAELKILKHTNLEMCKSLFLEIHTHDYTKPWDKEPYKGQCYKEDLESYLVDYQLHSIGMDNANKNGQGNSFWIRNV